MTFIKKYKKMPKKKIQHKGKPKHSTTESEDFAFRINDSETTEEEYITVANCETNKYKPRAFESNWAKYESSLSDFDCGDSETNVPKTNDFNDLLKTASSDCSHFEFNSEKLWKSENKTVVTSKIFDLDLNFLSSGLACVPFYERMGLDKEELSVEVIKRFDEEAENNLKQYNSLRGKGKSVVKSEEESNDTTVENDKNNEVPSGGIKETESGSEDSSKSKVEKSKERNKLFDPDENLEDWLDSILDD